MCPGVVPAEVGTKQDLAIFPALDYRAGNIA